MAAAFGREVLFTREGGSGPEADLQDVLGAPVRVPRHQPYRTTGGTRPTRRSRWTLLLKGAEAAAHLWDELARSLPR